VLATEQFQTNESFLVGRYYAGIALDHALHDLVSASASALINVTDTSALLTAGLSWNSSESTSVALGLLVGVGKASDGLRVESEFGLYPTAAYADLRWYF
jgi:hypothetical protein